MFATFTKIFIIVLLIECLLKECEGKPKQQEGWPNRQVKSMSVEQLAETTKILNENWITGQVKLGPILPAEGQNGQKRVKRAFLRREEDLWPDRLIHFGFDDSATNRIKASVRAAIFNLQGHTCLKFREYDRRNDPEPLHYLNFINGAGCRTHVGYADYLGSQHNVSLQDSACLTPGTVDQVIGHGLGMFNEHQRTDRDDYVRILSNNIMPAEASFFHKCDPNDHNEPCMSVSDTPYDYGSVMHFFAAQYTRNGLPTIEAIDPANQDTMGVFAQHLSFLDTKLINMVYCSVVPSNNGNVQIAPNPCAQSSTVCQNGGYNNPSAETQISCDECICPDEWSGQHCESRAGKSTCGGDLTTTGNWQMLQQPSMNPGDKCVWFIRSPAGTKVDYKINYVNVGLLDSFSYPFCDVQYIEVKDKLDSYNLGNTGHRFCKNSAAGLANTTSTNFLVVIAQSFPQTTNGNSFSLSYGTHPIACTFNLLDASLLNGGSTTSCSGQSCTMQGATSALLSSCGPLVLKSASNPAGLTLTPDPSTNGGKVRLSCSDGLGILTASGFTGGAQMTGVTSVEQTKACCLVSNMARYSNHVNVVLSPGTAIDGMVYRATISSCYKVETIIHNRSVEEVCEGIHRLKTVTNNIVVDCVGNPGQIGTWANFPGCIPLSGPGGNAVTNPVHKIDRPGGAIKPPTPIHNINSAAECAERCREYENSGQLGGKFGCVSYAYLDATTPSNPSTCWLKEIVPNAGPPGFQSYVNHIWSGVFEGTIRCNDGSTLPCKKWCDGVIDCQPNGEDELGCPEPCNTVHSADNNACGSALVVDGTAPVEGGKYFQCSPGHCLACSKVCDKPYFVNLNAVRTPHCPAPNSGLDEADATCVST